MKVSRKLTLRVTGVTRSSIAGAFFAAAAGSGQAPAQAAIKVALVTDVGGLNDKGFNTLANVGIKKAKAQLGDKLETRIYITTRTPTARRTSSGRPRTATSS